VLSDRNRADAPSVPGPAPTPPVREALSAPSSRGRATAPALHHERTVDATSETGCVGDGRPCERSPAQRRRTRTGRFSFRLTPQEPTSTPRYRPAIEPPGTAPPYGSTPASRGRTRRRPRQRSNPPRYRQGRESLPYRSHRPHASASARERLATWPRRRPPPASNPRVRPAKSAVSPIGPPPWGCVASNGVGRSCEFRRERWRTDERPSRGRARRTDRWLAGAQWVERPWVTVHHQFWSISPARERLGREPVRTVTRPEPTR